MNNYSPETRLAVDQLVMKGCSNAEISGRLDVPKAYAAHRRHLVKNQVARAFKRAADLANGGSK